MSERKRPRGSERGRGKCAEKQFGCSVKAKQHLGGRPIALEPFSGLLQHQHQQSSRAHGYTDMQMARRKYIVHLSGGRHAHAFPVNVPGWVFGIVASSIRPAFPNAAASTFSTFSVCARVSAPVRYRPRFTSQLAPSPPLWVIDLRVMEAIQFNFGNKQLLPSASAYITRMPR